MKHFICNLTIIAFFFLFVSCLDFQEENEMAISDALEAFISIDLDTTVMWEVSSMINRSLDNGFDEVLYLRELWTEEPEVKVSSNQCAPTLKSRLENYYSTHATKANSTFDFLSNNNCVIYWPYSDRWDGETLPVIVPMPENEEQEWNYGYRRIVNSNGEIDIESIYVDDDYAFENPVWIIKQGEIDYENLPNFNKGEYIANGVAFNIPETKTVDTVHIWRMSQAQVTKQYDNIFQGSSNFALTITYPIISGAVNGYSMVYTVFTRSEIRNKTWKSIYLLLNTDWIPAEISNGMFIVETDGGPAMSTTLTTTYKDPTTGAESNVSTTITYDRDDDIVYQMIYKRSYVYSSYGHSVQVADNGGFNFLMTIQDTV